MEQTSNAGFGVCFLLALGKPAGEVIDARANLFIGFIYFFDFCAGVKDGGMVPSAQVAADFLQTVSGELPSEIHADLARQGDALTSLLALEVCDADVKFAADGFNNVSHCNRARGNGLLNAEGLAGQLGGNGLAGGFGCGIQDS